MFSFICPHYVLAQRSDLERRRRPFLFFPQPTLEALTLEILPYIAEKGKLLSPFFMIIFVHNRKLCIGIYCWYRKKHKWPVIVGCPFRPPKALGIEQKRHRSLYKTTPAVLHCNTQIDNAKIKKEYLFGVHWPWWRYISLLWWEICCKKSTMLTLPSPLDKYCTGFAENLFPNVCILFQVFSTWRIGGLGYFSLLVHNCETQFLG